MNFFLRKNQAIFLPFLFLVLTFKIEALEAGDFAPKFSLPDLFKDHVTYSLEEKQDLLVYVDFWASWCAPCRLSMPALEQLYREFSGDGFYVLAVNVDAIKEDAIGFLKDFPVSYSVLADPEGIVSQLYNVIGMPSGYLINRKGKIIHSHIGFRRGDEEVLRKMIRNELEK
ncbi:MAG: TlpA disulfide reductase family protein [Halieaceae bacterium]|nr:TlpA disulfide reductase family protein [Halieaceae bacterium]